MNNFFFKFQKFYFARKKAFPFNKIVSQFIIDKKNDHLHKKVIKELTSFTSDIVI